MCLKLQFTEKVKQLCEIFKQIVIGQSLNLSCFMNINKGINKRYFHKRLF